jgi:Ca-activated chloride channel family protein
MSLLYPSFLWLLIPLVVLLWRSAYSFVNKIHLIILMLITITLSRPVVEQTAQEREIEGRNLIIALDLSYSMNATDIQPSRYTFAKETIYQLLKNNPTDNIMLIAFTTNPLLLSPPTTDHHLIKIALESLNREFILTKGTSLKNLFQKLSTIKETNQHLILITDGGEEQDIDGLKATLKESDTSLTILALGTKQGTTIKDRDDQLLKDEEGNLVISRVNPLLKSLSSSYIEASNSPKATADTLYRSLLVRSNLAKKMQQTYWEFYQIPLFFAMLLFLMVHTRAARYLTFLSLFLSVSNASSLDNYHLTQAYHSYQEQDYNATESHLQKIDTPSLQSSIALANTYYKQGKYTKAIERYQSIQSTSIKTKQHLYYNIANAYAKLSQYKDAKIYYAKVLQLGRDEDATFNLKLIALLSDKPDAQMGIAHPKSQNGSSSKSEKKKSQNPQRDEDKPSSGGSGEGERNREKKDKKHKLKSNHQEERQPLSSKVYELINEGYIYEKQPW